MIFLKKLDAMYRDMATACGGKRVAVVCHDCRKRVTVDTVECLRHGWPKCHGQTMALAQQRAARTEAGGEGK